MAIIVGTNHLLCSFLEANHFIKAFLVLICCSNTLQIYTIFESTLNKMKSVGATYTHLVDKLI